MPEGGIFRKFLALIKSYQGPRNELFFCKNVGGRVLSATWAHDLIALRGSASSSLAALIALVDKYTWYVKFLLSCASWVFGVRPIAAETYYVKQ
jgi:hypothetical protein